MKIAIAGKGGVGKTTFTAWFGDYLARLGNNVWLVDADTAFSLGQASGVAVSDLPEPLSSRQDLVQERIRQSNSSMMDLNPHVGDLPESLSISLPVSGKVINNVTAGKKRLLVMGGTTVGGGCACEANALVKALLAHLVLEREEWVLVDMEAGVEHLGRGTVAHADALLVVSEPGLRSLETAASIGTMAKTLGLTRQVLVLNRTRKEQAEKIPQLMGLPEARFVIPFFTDLEERQLASPSVLGLVDTTTVQLDCFFKTLLQYLIKTP